MIANSVPRVIPRLCPAARTSALAFAVFLFSLRPGTVSSQAPATAPVRGTVVGPEGTPLAGALVRLSGLGDSVRTSTTGEFHFPRVTPGPELLWIAALGHEIRRLNIQVAPGSGWTGTVELEPAIHVIPEIEVRSAYGKPPEFAHTTKYDDFFRRRHLGIGTFRTREDIERKGSLDLVSALQMIPGVSVSATPNPYGQPEVRFRIARCPGQPPNIAIYIDGRRLPLFLKHVGRSELSGLLNSPPGQYDEKKKKSSCEDCTRLAEAFQSVLLRDIEFIEFYRGPGQIPAELGRDVCAALVVWTR